MKKFSGLFFFLLVPVLLSAQIHSTKGTRFWMSFMAENNILQGAYSLILSTEKPCEIKIKSSDGRWEKEIYLDENCADTIQVPPLIAVVERYNHTLSKSLLITSSDSISVYAQYYLTASFDIACILPENELGDEYIIQAYPNKDNDAQFLVLATQDSTIIDIYPSCPVSGNFSKIKPILIRLDCGEVYQIHNLGKDLSGSVIKSHDNKKIAVFNGSSLAFVPDDHDSGDYVFEQALPVTAWGKQFIIANTLDKPVSRIRVTASKDSTSIKINEIYQETINSFETAEFELQEDTKACFIETSEPCMVYQYMVGWSYFKKNNNPYITGDPSMCTILPMNYNLYNTNFNTSDMGSTTEHRLNIITLTQDTHAVKLDGKSISSHFSPLADTPQYSYARLRIKPGEHNLSSIKGFIAYAYGYGRYESYFYYLGYTASPKEN